MKYLLDSTALLAFLLDEPEADRFETLWKQTLFARTDIRTVLPS